MSITAIITLELARREFFMNATYIMSRKLKSNVFWGQEAEISLTAIKSLESARRKFFMNSTQNMCKNSESNVFGLKRPK